MERELELSGLKPEELEELGFGLLGVEEVIHCLVPLSDGCHLALRVWGPVGSLGALGVVRVLVSGEPGEAGTRYPAVLEYLPYRKADWTSCRDHKRHPWLASHGYVVVRADLRGSGDSEGEYYDEYLKQEQDDACELIGWITSQSWSSGKVGMYGKSWGGFNGLQVASRQPHGLAAVISLYSTDDRFEEDIHWKGGCVLGGGMLSWAATMFCWDARPPQPQYKPDWTVAWRERLEKAGQCVVNQWLLHQTKDSYWQHGSVGLSPETVKIPVLAIGGWHDGYTRPALRMAQTLPHCKAIVGPWSHNWPDEAVPGPNIGFMDECLGWWDEHLKGQSGCPVSKVRWFQCLGVEKPGPSVQEWQGQWQQGDHSSGVLSLSYSMGCKGLLELGPSRSLVKPVKITFSGEAGLACGEWLSFGAPDLPGDHRRVSPFQACWTSSEMAQDTHIFGEVAVMLDCRVDRQVAQVYCGLCHVFPDGASRLITYGLLNLNRLEPSGLLTPGHLYSVQLQLDPIGYTLPRHHRLQVMVSPGSWPTSWPSPLPVCLTVEGGQITVPTLDKMDSQPPSSMFQHAAPRMGPAKRIQQLRPATFDRVVKYGLSDQKREIKVTTDGGNTYYPDVDTEMDEVNTDTYSILGDDPISAEHGLRR